MSMYDNNQKDHLYYEITDFLEEYKDEEPITTLLNIVTTCIEESLEDRNG